MFSAGTSRVTLDSRLRPRSVSRFFFPTLHPFFFRYALSAPSVALLSGVRVCHLEVSSIPGFVSLVNQRVNETGFSYLHNLGS